MLNNNCTVLHFHGFSSDKLVEQDVGVPSVAEIFEIYGEDFFRDKEVFCILNLSIAKFTLAHFIRLYLVTSIAKYIILKRELMIS